MNLVPAIIKMQEQINEKNTKHKSEIQALKDGLAALRKLNTVCEKCRGSGEVRKVDGAGQLEHVVCNECRGTGGNNGKIN